MKDRVWTEERIRELVSEDPDTIGAWLKSHIPTHRMMAEMLLQTREELETAKSQLSGFQDQYNKDAEELSRLRAALERIVKIDRDGCEEWAKSDVKPDSYWMEEWADQLNECGSIARQALTPKAGPQ